VEFEPAVPSHLGAVVTNCGYSDWSLQDFPGDGTGGYCLRVRRACEDYLVEYADDDSALGTCCASPTCWDRPDRQRGLASTVAAPKVRGSERRSSF
jgi:regulation of enolase protein 1 (concanavalin A-like superfamily)